MKSIILQISQIGLIVSLILVLYSIYVFYYGRDSKIKSYVRVVSTVMLLVFVLCVVVISYM